MTIKLSIFTQSCTVIMSSGIKIKRGSRKLQALGDNLGTLTDKLDWVSMGLRDGVLCDRSPQCQQTQSTVDCNLLS